ncbi:IS66 family insertion sequence element accessory protein TnpB [Ligilactobacillus acidipiscis]|uniref:IS66 family insertion sequence element accessory protein TnpB n=1 Tax=Ligilactobacillus acidipiscis TaxID=89059 RepID=UPI003A4E3805
MWKTKLFFLLLYKRLEDGRLQWPSDQAAVRKLQPKQLKRLLNGRVLDSTVHQYDPKP